jgi:hypothetical protein
MVEEPQVKEMPTMEEPKTATPSPLDESKDLLSQLEKLGVKKPEQLQGMATASEQSGKLANMLGEIRRENAELKRMLQETASARPKQQDDPYNPQPVNIEDVVERAVGKFYQNTILGPQMKAQQEFQAQIQEVQEDDHYSVLGEQFQQYIAVPKTQYAIQSGQTSLAREYRRFKDRYFTQLLTKVTDNYRTLLEGGAKPQGSKAAPHVESSSSSNYVMPETTPDMKENLKNIAAKGRGTDDDIDAMLKAILPDGDPILRRGR